MIEVSRSSSVLGSFYAGAYRSPGSASGGASLDLPLQEEQLAQVPTPPPPRCALSGRSSTDRKRERPLRQPILRGGKKGTLSNPNRLACSTVLGVCWRPRLEKRSSVK